MGLFFIYSLKVALCLAAFYLVYKLLLSRETFYGFNRAVVLCIIGTSLLLPLVHVSTASPTAGLGGFVVVEGVIAEAVAAEPSGFSMTAAQACFAVYIIGVAFFAFRWAWSLFSLVRLMRGGRVVSRDGGVRIIVVEGDTPPFSWMNNIVISEADYAGRPEYILAHERAHVAGRHSADIMLCDALIVAQWFNPAAWLLKAELQDLHEYEADRAVLASGVDARSYQLMLIRKAVGDKLFSMANNLNQCSLNKRITMMQKMKSNPWRRGRSLLAVPVAAFAVAAFATPKAESLSAEIENESNALVSSVVPAAETQVAEPSTVAAAVAVRKAEAAQSDAEAQPAEAVAEAGVPGPDDKVYDIAEQQPEFPGGQVAMAKWLGETIRYPAEAAKKGVEGRVVVRFVIGSDGTVGDAKVVHGVDPLLDQEALRVINAMPKWIPGKQGGKAVAVRYMVPITFRQDVGLGGGNVRPDEYDGSVITINGKVVASSGMQTVRMDGNRYYIVDGKHVEDISNLKADQIESITVKTDAKSTTDKYGDAAKDGVIIITTKKAGKQ